MNFIEIPSVNGEDRVSVVHPTGLESFANLKSNLSAVNELSVGLGTAIPTGLRVSYNDVLQRQGQILHDVIETTSKLNLDISKIAEITTEMVAPLSASIAGIGLLSAGTANYLEIGRISQPQLQATQNLSGLFLNTLKNQQESITSSLRMAEATGVIDIARSTAATAQVVTNGISSVLRSLSTYPTEIKLPNLEIIQNVSRLDATELNFRQELLDKMLGEISPDLVEYRVGCWEALDRKGADYIGQASSSMRRLVDDLLKKLAPDDEVAETRFFKSSPNAKDSRGNPTRHARLHYALKLDYKKAEHLERLKNLLVGVYDNLPAWDHKPLRKDEFVRGTFIAIEGCLISLLAEANTRGGRE